MVDRYGNGMPGVGSDREAQSRNILATLDGASFLPGGGVISGSESRDLGNTNDTDILRAGLLMGRITATKKWAPSIIGVTTVAYADNDLTLTVSAAVAAEIVRRVGATGTIKVVGPPSAAGVVSVADGVYSAINTTSGVITLADMNDAFIAGSLVCADDGSYLPITVLADQWGIKVRDVDSNDIDVSYPEILVGGQIDASQILNYTSDASIQAWIKSQLRTNGIGFVFDDDFIG